MFDFSEIVNLLYSPQRCTSDVEHSSKCHETQVMIKELKKLVLTS